jgi:hypothetical protein
VLRGYLGVAGGRIGSGPIPTVAAAENVPEATYIRQRLRLQRRELLIFGVLEHAGVLVRTKLIPSDSDENT